MRTPPINTPHHGTVIVAGEEPVELRTREFDLLHYLLRHRGEVRTAFQIYTDVWGLPPSVIRLKGTSTIETCVSRIRIAVPEVVIAKARGVGWVLV